MLACNVVNTPVTVSSEDDQGELFDVVQARLYRKSAARVAYLSQDRLGLSHASCDLATGIADSTTTDMWRQRRAARYLKGHARAKINCEFPEPVQEFDAVHRFRLGNGVEDSAKLEWRLVVARQTFFATLDSGPTSRCLELRSSGEAEAYAAVRGMENVVKLSSVVTELYPHEKWSLVLCLDATAGKDVLLRKRR